MNAEWALLGALILVVTSLALHAWAGRYSRGIQIVNLAWIVCFLLIATDGINYDDASSTSWASLIVALLVFNFGAFLALGGPRLKAGRVNIRFPSSTDHRFTPIVGRKLLITFTVIYAFGFIGYLSSINTRFGIETLIVDPTSIRAAEGESYLASVPLLFRLFLYLGPLLIGLYGFQKACHNPLPAVVRWAVVVLISISQLLMLQRTNLFMGLLFLVCLVLVSPPSEQRSQWSKRKQFTTLSFAGLFLVMGFQIVGNSLGKTGDSLSRLGMSADWLAESGFTSIFFYITSGTIALLFLMESTNPDWPPVDSIGLNVGDYNPQTWGASFLEPFLKIVPITEPFPAISPFIDIGTYTNVYTWFEQPYRDFRLFGMVFFALVIGLLLSRLHIRSQSSAVWFWTYSWLLVAAILGPFVNKLRTPAFLGVLFIMVLLTCYSARIEHRKGIQSDSIPHK